MGGMANGMNLAAALEADQARKEIHHGCMLNLGWTTEPIPPKAVQTAAAAASKAASDEEMMEARWRQAIETFMDVEAAAPDGIDYRNDKTAMKLLDQEVKFLAMQPANQEKAMSWFLIEGDKRVRDTMIILAHCPDSQCDERGRAAWERKFPEGPKAPGTSR